MNYALFIIQIGLRSLIKKYKSKGVHKENQGITQHDKENVGVYYVNKLKYYPAGVRKEQIIHTNSISYKLHCIKNTIHQYSKSKTRPKCLYVNRQCVCGSKYHSRTTHLKCPCNPRYDDAIES